MIHSLDDLNRAAPGAFSAAIGDTFELAPWVAEAAAARRPFATVAALHETMMGELAPRRASASSPSSAAIPISPERPPGQAM